MGMKLSAVDSVCAVLRSAGLPEPETEHRFHPERLWRLDLAWPSLMVALEIDGGVWTQGRHTRGGGYSEDCRKLNEAAALGWTVLRVTTDMVRSGEAFRVIERVLKERLASGDYSSNNGSNDAV